MEPTQEQSAIFDPIKVDDAYFAEHYKEQEDFYAILKTLPRSIVDILFDVNTANILKQICQTNQLNPLQAASLSRLIRQVLSTELSFGNLINELRTRLAVDDTKAKTIAAALISQLFNDALEDIKKVHQEKLKRAAVEWPKETASVAPVLPAQSASLALPMANPNNVLDLKNKQHN